MHRFFVPAGTLDRAQVQLEGPISHQITSVLRLRAGQTVVLLDNSGWEYEVEIAGTGAGRVVGVVRAKHLSSTEPRVKVTLYQGVIRASNFEIVLQKGTELGVAAFVPLVCERSSVGQLDEIGQEKWARWQRIIAEAAEQSRRAKLPLLQPAAFFPHVCESVRGTSLIAYEGESDQNLRELLHSVGATRRGSVSRPFSINLLIGPEGGFSEQEVNLARTYGLRTFGMGPRILRSETAAMVAAGLILYELGDLEHGSDPR